MQHYLANRLAGGLAATGQRYPSYYNGLVPANCYVQVEGASSWAELPAPGCRGRVVAQAAEVPARLPRSPPPAAVYTCLPDDAQCNASAGVAQKYCEARAPRRLGCCCCCCQAPSCPTAACPAAERRRCVPILPPSGRLRHRQRLQQRQGVCGAPHGPALVRPAGAGAAQVRALAPRARRRAANESDVPGGWAGWGLGREAYITCQAAGWCRCRCCGWPPPPASWPSQKHLCLLSALPRPAPQLNLCMMPPGLSTARFSSPAAQTPAG